MQLPSEIADLVDSVSAVEVHIGESKSRVFRISGKSGEAYFLKVTESDYVANELETETKILNWLGSRGIAAPKAVRCVRGKTQTCFLMTEVSGRSMAEAGLDAKRCLELGAEFLRRLHLLNTDDCPFDRRLEITRRLARENLENGLVDEADFDAENRGISAKQVFAQIDFDIVEDLVFTHGDFCFPNIIVSDAKVSGVVDLGRAGIADRYQDIALFLRSYASNVGQPDIEHFLACYGFIEKIDSTKLRLFRTLDEFF